jgi:uncharacterized damage-inducible protein DinB
MTTKTMTEKDSYLATFEREYQTTLKLLRNYPAAKLDIRPVETLADARNLIWMLVMSQGVVQALLAPELKPTAFPPAPATLDEMIAAFEHTHRESMAKVSALSEADFNGTVRMPVGPKQVGDVRRADALWMMLYDTIHHRGQLTVYTRKAGGIVPSIYGQTFEEPWW